MAFFCILNMPHSGQFFPSLLIKFKFYANAKMCVCLLCVYRRTVATVAKSELEKTGRRREKWMRFCTNRNKKKNQLNISKPKKTRWRMWMKSEAFTFCVSSTVPRRLVCRKRMSLFWMSGLLLLFFGCFGRVCTCTTSSLCLSSQRLYVHFHSTLVHTNTLTTNAYPVGKGLYHVICVWLVACS